MPPADHTRNRVLRPARRAHASTAPRAARRAHPQLRGPTTPLRAGSRSRRRPVPSPRVGRVLIVDDEEQLRVSVARLLTRAGHVCALASDGDEVLPRTLEFAPDVVVMDVVMERVSGFEALERLRADDRTRSMPVILITGSAALRRTQPCLEKPVRPAELLARVEAALAETRARARV